MKKIIGVLCTFLTLAQAFAVNKTYYFSTTDGDDTRTTTQAQSAATPWRTISKFNSSMSTFNAGDTIRLKSGDVYPGAGFTNTKGLYITSYGTGAQPLITSFVTVTSWTSLGSGIYESNALSITSAAVNMVTINDALYAMGRYPNENASNGGWLNFESHGTTSITDNQLASTSLDNSWTNAMVVIRTTHSAVERRTITSIAGTTINYNSATVSSLVNGYGYFVQNTFAALDQFGEWYYNTATNKIDVYFGSAGPTGYTVKVASQDMVATVHASNTTFDNIAFTGANSATVYGDWVGIKNLQILNSRIGFGGIDGMRFANMVNLIVDNSIVDNNNVNAINLYYQDTAPIVRYSLLLNNTMHAGMIQKDASNQCGAAIYCGQFLTAIGNTVHNAGYEGIRADGNNVYVYRNQIDSTCRVLDDGGGIYTWVGSANGTKTNRVIRGNAITAIGYGSQYGTTESLAQGYCWGGGIYLDDNVNNVTADSNTVANCNMAGFYAHNARTYTLTNNTFYNNAVQYSSQHDGGANAITGIVVKRNQLLSLLSGQLVMRLASSANDFSTMGILDSNFYGRPLNDSNVIRRMWFSNTTTDFSLSGWQSAGYGYDAHSRKTPANIAGDVSKIIFRIAGPKPTTLRFCTDCVDANNALRQKRVDLGALNSVLLFKAN